MKALRALGRWIRQLGRFDDGPKMRSGEVLGLVDILNAQASQVLGMPLISIEPLQVEAAEIDITTMNDPEPRHITGITGARCKVCKRLLIHHDSIERGAGRVCARKLKAANGAIEQ